PNFVSVGGYDGMHLIYEALKKTQGKTDGDSLIAAMKGMRWESPRGMMSIDPETRDIVQPIYIRKVEKINGELWNTEFAKFDAVKDPRKVKKERAACERDIGARPRHRSSHRDCSHRDIVDEPRRADARGHEQPDRPILDRRDGRERIGVAGFEIVEDKAGALHGGGAPIQHPGGGVSAAHPDRRLPCQPAKRGGPR